ncbi:MAG TPA: hypothetical protein VJ775_05670 [Sphingomicrobium sp.]|nr:hypothetical protein [Sphingomicrobium sp.]
MSSAPAPQEIWRDACWLAQAVDPNAGLVRLVEMSAEDYREASFLDDRMFDKPRTKHLLKWGELAEATPADARTDARWIFHIGHVGSTLVARLLGELESVLCVREPRALRDLLFFPHEVRAQYIPTVQALFSRTFAPGQSALVKTTSAVSEIAGELVAEGQAALFLYAKPRSYISGILAGENSRTELAAMADMRRRRLASRGLILPEPRSEADAAASAWACEMTALEAVADGRTVLWADFDSVLGNLDGWLQMMAGHFDFAASEEDLRAIANGPLTRRYSKATEHEYSADLRGSLLSEAEERHRSDIDGALAMLAKAAETAPLLRKALDRAQAES